MSNKKIEEELAEVLSSYDKHDDIYSFIDVIISYNDKGVDKQTSIETLNNILVKLEINSSVGLSGVAIFSDLKIKKTKNK